MFCGYHVDAEKLEMNSRGLLRDGGESSRNTFTVRNGHCPGATPGTWEEQGNLSLTRVPGSGGRRVRAGKARRLADLDAARPGEVPCISYMEGTLSYSARHKRSTQDRHAGKHSHADRGHGQTSLRRDHAETDPAEMPPDQDAPARPPLGAPTEE